MSQSNVQVPPAPVADPAAVTPPAAPVAAPAAVVPPVVAPAAVIAAVPPTTGTAPGEAAPQDEPKWFKPRLEQAQRAAATALLKSLGVRDEAEGIALLKKAREAEDAAKTELQRAKERGDTLAAQAARAGDLEKVVTARADIEMGALSEAQKAAVLALAGDDAAKRLATIDALKPTWASAVAAPALPVAAPVTPAPAAVPPAPAAPATTSPPPTAPAAVTTSPPDHKAEYKRLKTSNPHAAAAYLNAHANEIYPRS